MHGWISAGSYFVLVETIQGAELIVQALGRVVDCMTSELPVVSRWSSRDARSRG